MESVPKVALLLETSREYGRGILRGIVRYSQLHGPWSFHVTPGNFEKALPKLQRWDGTGIIARVETAQVADAILASGLPVVALDLPERQLLVESPSSGFCEVVTNSHDTARMAAEHLLDRGFRHYGFVGVSGYIWSRRRQESFCERLGEAGFQPHVYRLPRRKRDRQWDREQTTMADWLRAMPKPIGLMACNDDRGREVLQSCRTAGIRVPDEVAVVGVDNDSLLCDLADPPLSSVTLNTEDGGFEAAALLDRLMHGEIEQREQVVIEPVYVVTRRSTDVIALDDREVSGAVRLIRESVNRPIQVDEVVAATGFSRRTLEIRFQRALGRSIHAEIRRVRLERAKELLLQTDLPIPNIAEASGFTTPSYFAQTFRQEFATTPARYRREHR